MNEEQQLQEMGGREVAAATEYTGTEGLEGLGPEMVLLPKYIIVQPGSKHAIQADGQEAPAGVLFNMSSKMTKEELFISILATKKFSTEVVNPETQETEMRDSYHIIAFDHVDEEVVKLILKPGSFNSLAVLNTEMRQRKIAQAWRFMVKVSVERSTSQEYKFYVTKFTIQQEIDEADLGLMAQKFADFKNFFKTAGAISEDE